MLTLRLVGLSCGALLLTLSGVLLLLLARNCLIVGLHLQHVTIIAQCVRSAKALRTAQNYHGRHPPFVSGWRTYLNLRGDASAPLDGLGVDDIGADADGVHTGDGEGEEEVRAEVVVVKRHRLLETIWRVFAHLQHKQLVERSHTL